VSAPLLQVPADIAKYTRSQKLRLQSESGKRIFRKRWRMRHSAENFLPNHFSLFVTLHFFIIFYSAHRHSPLTIQKSSWEKYENPGVGVCAILLRLYTCTENLKKEYVHKPTVNFWTYLFLRKHVFIEFLQLFMQGFSLILILIVKIRFLTENSTFPKIFIISFCDS
jgi:hypothetical protein